MSESLNSTVENLQVETTFNYNYSKEPNQILVVGRRTFWILNVKCRVFFSPRYVKNIHEIKRFKRHFDVDPEENEVLEKYKCGGNRFNREELMKRWLHAKTWTFILLRRRGWFYLTKEKNIIRLFSQRSHLIWNCFENGSKFLISNEISLVCQTKNASSNDFLLQKFKSSSTSSMSVVRETTAAPQPVYWLCCR